VLEQSLPGERDDLTEEEAERRGLPDGCITDGDSWTLLIESKFAAKPTSEQLRRHVRTCERRGLEEVVGLLLTVHSAPPQLPGNVIAKQWSDVYTWLCRQCGRSWWARRCTEYMQVAEAKEAANTYLQEGKLTMFSGIPFGNGEAYAYGQAKRLLKLLREELCRDKRLSKNLRADLEASGRPAITGRDHSSVWDFIPIRRKRTGRVLKHTEHPHLTLSISQDRVGAYITTPNKMNSGLRAQLLRSSFEEFELLVQKVTTDMVVALKGVDGFVPEVIVLQRHFRSQRSPGVVDCQLRFDGRTTLSKTSRYRGQVKRQPQWVKAAYDALSHRRSNLEFQIGCSFPYDTCPVTRDKSIVSAISNSLLACAPLLKRVTAQ